MVSDQRPDVELRRAGQHGHGQQQHGRQQVQTAAEQPCGDPCVDARQQGRGHQQQAVPAGQAMDGRHAALGQPLVGHPRLAGAGEAERIFADDLARGEHFLAGGDVPEGAGIAEHVAASGDQQDQQDREEETGELTKEEGSPRGRRGREGCGELIVACDSVASRCSSTQCDIGNHKLSLSLRPPRPLRSFLPSRFPTSSRRGAGLPAFALRRPRRRWSLGNSGFSVRGARFAGAPGCFCRNNSAGLRPSPSMVKSSLAWA